MRRRELLLGLSGVLFSAITARASAAERKRKIGVLMGLSEDNPSTRSGLQHLRSALGSAGWREPENLQMVLRFAAGDPERTRKLALELVEMAPDLIVCHTTPAAAALHEATRVLPIVFVSITDPVTDGFVGNIAYPGGNMTGFTNYDFAMGAKWLEILKEIAPETSRVVVLLNPEVGSYYTGYLQSIEAAARVQSIVATSAVIRQPDDIDSAIAALGRQPGAGLIFPPSAPITAHQRRIIELTAEHRVPAIYPFAYFAKQGGLAAYGTDLDDLFLRAGGYVDRILRGEKPADLPVQAPTKFELVINLKTAKMLGLSVPQLLLAQADEVIE